MRLAAAPCPCRRPFALIEDIQGRVEEVLHLPAGAGGEVAVHPITFHRILDAVPASGWQVVQQADSLNILLSGVSDGFSEETMVGTLTQALAAQGASAPPVEVGWVSAIPRGAAGKAPLIRKKIG